MCKMFTRINRLSPTGIQQRGRSGKAGEPKQKVTEVTSYARFFSPIAVVWEVIAQLEILVSQMSLHLCRAVSFVFTPEYDLVIPDTLGDTPPRHWLWSASLKWRLVSPGVAVLKWEAPGFFSHMLESCLNTTLVPHISKKLLFSWPTEILMLSITVASVTLIEYLTGLPRDELKAILR